jgi:hypothetical protein
VSDPIRYPQPNDRVTELLRFRREVRKARGNLLEASGFSTSAQGEARSALDSALAHLAHLERSIDEQLQRLPDRHHRPSE